MFSYFSKYYFYPGRLIYYNLKEILFRLVKTIKVEGGATHQNTWSVYIFNITTGFRYYIPFIRLLSKRITLSGVSFLPATCYGPPGYLHSFLRTKLMKLIMFSLS
jgi:hypothetical protein